MPENPETPSQRPPHLLWWAVGCVVVNIALDTTINKFGSSWPNWIIVLLWGVALIPFGMWFFLRNRSFFNREKIINQFRKHPVSLIAACSLFLGILIFAGIRVDDRLRNGVRKETVASNRPIQVPKSAASPIPPISTLTPAPHELVKKPKNKPPSMPPPTTLGPNESGAQSLSAISKKPTVGGQVEIAPGASVQQSTTGDCSPAIIGNGNTNNCYSGQKHLPQLTANQTADLVNVMRQFKGHPVWIRFMTSSAPETIKFAKTLSEALNDAELKEDPPNPTFAQWPPFPPGISFVVGEDQIETASALGIELRKLGIVSGPVPAQKGAAGGFAILISDPN